MRVEGEEGTSEEQSSSGTPTTLGGSGTAPFATFPDAASLNSRLDQAGRAHLQRTAESLGFGTVEEMTAAAKKARELEESSKSELEKARTRAAELEKEVSKRSAREVEILKRAEFKVRSAQLGVIDPDVAYLAADLTGVTVDGDTGSVAGVDEAIRSLLAAKPYLKGAPTSLTNINVGPGNGGSQTPQLSDEERTIAERLGIKPEEYAARKKG